MNKTVRVGVIGVGHLGQHHARIYANCPRCQLTGVVDIDKKRARRIARSYKTQAFFDYRNLVDNVDGVSIAVPTVSHYSIARDFLENNIHVLVEKPITQTVKQAEELILLAKERNLILQVGHVEQFNVAIRKLKEIVKEPGFIEVHRLGGFDPRVKDVGVVMDLMIHDIDVILRIVNSPIKRIEAVGVPVLTDKEDIANARITFESGCIANVTVSRITPKQLRKIRIFQRDAYISIDYQTQSMDIYNVEQIKKHRSSGIPAKIVRRSVRLRREEPLKSELYHFVDCIIRGETPVVTGEQARKALEVVVQISQLIKEKLSGQPQ